MTDTADRKKTRHRSPAYPSIDLRTAIEKAEIVYRAEKRHSAPAAIISQHCGYDITSSGGARAIAALKQFGLLLEEGNNEDRQLRLSELALDILIAESDESPQRLRAIKTAALSPPLHRKIWEKYGGNLPSKPTLRAFLVRDMEFNDAQVDRFIRQLFQTVSYARLDEPDIIDDADDEESSESSDLSSDYTPAMGGALFGGNQGAGFVPRSSKISTVLPLTYHGSMATTIPATPAPQLMQLPITMPSLRVAVLNVPPQLTEAEYEFLVNSLKLFKDALVQRPAEPPPQPLPAPA